MLQKNASCFHKHFVSLSFYWGLSLLIVRAINDQRLLIPVILLLLLTIVCLCVHFPSLGFAGSGLYIACVLVGVVNLLGLKFFL